jgi:large subunit ribosomal protein L3
MPLGLLGKKLGQTRVYDAKGRFDPVTVVLAGPNRVLQAKRRRARTATTPCNSASATRRNSGSPSRLLGHIKKFNGVAVKRIKEFRNFSKEVKPGDVVGPTLFAPGDFMDAIGVTKGRGFEGVVKRHHFAAATRRTAHKGWHRRAAPSASACSPARSCAA